MGTTVLQEIAAFVNSETPDKPSGLQALADAVTRFLGADRVTLILFDDKSREIRQFLRGGVGWAEIMAAVGYEELSRGLSGWALRTGELAVSPKGIPDPRESPEVRERREATRCGSILVAPLGGPGHRSGTLTAINRPDQPDFSEKDVENFGIFAGFASQVVQSLENREEAVSAVRSKTNFLSNLTHELRTPLNAILGFSHILADTPLDHYQKSMVSTVIESGVRLLGTVDNVIDLAQLEAGVFHLETLPFSPRSALETLASQFRPQALEKNLGFRVTSDPVLPPVLSGDAVRLGQAWGHILSNALKFTDQGSVEVHLAARITAWDRHELVLQVKDTGIGLQEKYAGKWFRPFHQEDGSFSRKYGGTGLGLALCDRIVRNMGGGVSLRGEPGVGTSVRVWVVLGAPGEGAASPGADRPRILVVHPDSDGGLHLVNLLDRLGCAADVAVSQEDAVVRAAASPYEAVLVDLTDGPGAFLPLVEASRAGGFHLVGIYPPGSDPETLPGEPWTACLVQPVGRQGLQAVLDLCGTGGGR